MRPPLTATAASPTPTASLLPCDKLLVTLAGRESRRLLVHLRNAAAVAKLVLRALARQWCDGHRERLRVPDPGRPTLLSGDSTLATAGRRCGKLENMSGNWRAF